MKRIITLSLIMCCLLLTACDNASIGVIGGADGPTSIIVGEQKDNIKKTYDVKRYFKEHYVDERKLPVLDIHIENPFVSDDRTLILDDSIENNLELMIYEYYQNMMSGSYQKIKDVVVEGSLYSAIENEEKHFNEGIYYSKIVLDDIDLVDKDDLEEISEQNKQNIIEILDKLDMTEFAIIEVEKTITHNEKALSMAPQVGNGDVTRYYLLGKKDDTYKIIEVYWEGFMND